MQRTIKTPQDAFAYLGLPFNLPDVSGIAPKHQKAILALYQLYIITEALNKEDNDGEEWTPDYSGGQWHHFPYFRMDDQKGKERCSGFRFALSAYYSLSSPVGSRLEFLNEEVCDYAAETFLDLYRDAFVLLPQPASKEG